MKSGKLCKLLIPVEKKIVTNLNKITMNEDLKISPFAIKQGLILGLISVVFMILTFVLDMYGESATNWLSSAITVGFLFYAIRLYRTENDGFISLGQAIGLGTLISVVSGTIVSVFMVIYMKLIDGSIMEKQIEKQIEAMESRGMSDEQIDASLSVSEIFTSAPALLIVGILGSALLGVIVSLIIGLFLKKERPEFS